MSTSCRIRLVGWLGLILGVVGCSARASLTSQSDLLARFVPEFPSLSFTPLFWVSVTFVLYLGLGFFSKELSQWMAAIGLGIRHWMQKHLGISPSIPKWMSGASASGLNTLGLNQDTWFGVAQEACYRYTLPALVTFGVYLKFVAVTAWSDFFTSMLVVGVIIALLYLFIATVYAVLCWARNDWSDFDESVIAISRPNLPILLGLLALLVSEQAIQEFCIPMLVEGILGNIFLILIVTWCHKEAKQKAPAGWRVKFKAFINQTLRTPVILAFGVAVLLFWLAYVLPLGVMVVLLWVLKWIGKATIPISMVLVGHGLRGSVRYLNLKSVLPKFYAVVLGLIFVPMVCNIFCCYAYIWGFISYELIKPLWLYYAMSCSSSAYILIQKIKGQEPRHYVNIMFLMMLFAPVTLYYLYHF